jgi:hypothetical protein
VTALSRRDSISAGRAVTNEGLQQALETVARAKGIDQIELLVSEHPSLIATEFLDRLDDQIAVLAVWRNTFSGG